MKEVERAERQLKESVLWLMDLGYNSNYIKLSVDNIFISSNIKRS